MKKAMKNILLVTSLGLILITASGCIALLIGAAAGAGGVVYVKGELEKNFDATVAKVHKASIAGLKNLDMFILSDELNVHDASIRSEDAQGKKVTINIDALTERSSKIKIRVGLVGNKMKSQIILDAIERKL